MTSEHSSLRFCNFLKEEPGESEPLLQLTIRIKLARVTDELLRLKKVVDRSIWFQSPAQVDAYYAPNLNEMSELYAFLNI